MHVKFTYTTFVVIAILQSVKAQGNIASLVLEKANNLVYNSSSSIRDSSNFLNEYDFIIIGSGSGGSVMANRLSENKNWKILLLEAGREETIITEVPLTAIINSATGYTWNYQTDPKSQDACLGFTDQVCWYPKGRVLGGTSVLNYMVYTRGNRRDYDRWEELGNRGWSYKDVLPYFIKSENVKIPSLRNSPFRGTKGFVDVERSPYTTKLHKTFIEAGYEMGYENNDPNGEKQLGFSRVQATMRNGRRCSAAKAYLRSVASRKNLHISMRSMVTKIVIDPFTKTAIGVEFIKNKKLFVIKARKEVILSAGSINSPQLLMLSGIGPKEDLEKLNIPVHSNLRVGFNLHDHIGLTTLTFLVDQPVTIGTQDFLDPRNIFDYVARNRGPFTIPSGAEGIAFIKTNTSVLPDDYPDIELVMGTGAFTVVNNEYLRDITRFPRKFFDKVFGNVRGRPAFTIVPILMKPKSRGRVLLESANPFSSPIIRTNALSNKDDLKTLRDGIKIALQVGESKAFKKFGTKFHDVPFLGCEDFKFGSDDYWDCCLRNYATLFQHPVGTCKMGIDADAVVDSELKVYGIKNLRVVDGSIMPELPASHTNAIIYMIGEKAADMVKDRWNKNLSS